MGRRSKDKLSCVKWLETSFIYKRSVVDSVYSAEGTGQLSATLGSIRSQWKDT